MIKPAKKLLADFHVLLAKSKAITFIAAKIRNQCNLVISKRFGSASMDPHANGEYHLLKAVLPYCATYFDVGANKGEWTGFLLENKKTDFKCYLFEPGAVAFSYLKERFSGNNAIQLKNVALGDKEELLTFYEEANAGEMSSAIPGWANNTTTAIKIECTTIDTQIAGYKLPYLDFLKIDVEGFDLKVINGALQGITEQKIGLVQFEYNDVWARAGSSLAAAYQFFNDHHYQVYLLRPRGLISYDVKTYREFFSFSNFLAVSPKSYPLIKHLIL